LTLDQTNRAILGAILAAYTATHLGNRIRYNRQAVDETTPEQGNRRVVYSQRIFALLLPLTILTTTTIDGSRIGPTAATATIISLSTLSITAFILAAWPAKRSSKSDILKLWPMIVMIPFVIIACKGALTQQYGYQLVAASVGVIALLLLATLDPAIKSYRARAKWRSRQN
jgi:hypothetical protein